MNIIEAKYKNALLAVKILREMESEGKNISMAIETFHIIVPANKAGAALNIELSSFLKKLKGKNAIIIEEYGRDISIEDLEDKINLSMGISKKNIQDMIVKHELLTETKSKTIKTLATDSLPT